MFMHMWGIERAPAKDYIKARSELIWLAVKEERGERRKARCVLPLEGNKFL